MISLVFSILCPVYKIDAYFNPSTLVTSIGRCVKSSDHCQPGNLSREWEENGEQASTPRFKKGLATALEQVAVITSQSEVGLTGLH